MISKTKINQRVKRKTNPELVETINLAKKNNLLEVAKKLSGSTKQQKRINIETLNKMKEKSILVTGKVLGSGEIKQKISICALSFSSEAKEKLKKAGCEIKTIKEEIKKNPKLDGVKII